MLRQAQIKQFRLAVQQVLAPYQTCYGIKPGAWLWSVSIIVSFISIAVWLVAWLSAVDVALLYIVMVLLLWSGRSNWEIRLFTWGILSFTGLGLLIHHASANPAENPVLRYLLSSTAAVNWMTLLALAASVVCIARAGRHAEVRSLLIASLFMAVLGFLLRWHESWLPGEETGQIPLASDYDVLLLLFTGMVGLAVYYARAYRLYPWVLLPVALLALFLLGFPIEVDALPPLALPVLQHFWLKIHVPAMVLAWGALLLAGAVAAGYVMQSGRWSGETISAQRGQLYTDAMYRLLALGVLSLSIGLLAGQLWSDQAWGHYLIWEPKQIGTITLWFYFLAALHQRLQKNGQGLPLAWWLISGVPLLLFVAIGIDTWFEGRHFFIRL